MSIFVTGATGFIGRYTCAALTSQGQHVIAMMRRPEELAALRTSVTQFGGNPDLLSAVHGDLDLPNLGVTEVLPTLSAVIHLGARFAWGMSYKAAHRTNVAGAFSAADLAAEHQCRFLLITGFMLENLEHLSRLGIHIDQPNTTQWKDVYRRTGAYEASKLEAAVRLREHCSEKNIELVEIQPATVAGHSQTGDLDNAQPLYSLIDNLAKGRLTMVPGSPEHWLPLIPVDVLADIIAAACTADTPPARILALDKHTPNLQPMLSVVAKSLRRNAPQRYLPVPALRWLLRIPGMQTLMRTSIEALDFIQTTRFDTNTTIAFMQQYHIAMPSIHQVLIKSSERYCAQ